jgi:hypothetical protein
MTTKNSLLAFVIGLVVVTAGYSLYNSSMVVNTQDVDSSTQIPAQGKINIDAVCDGALAYMTFPNATAAEVFVAECKEGKHPQVIEQYKEQMGLGDGAAI